MILLTAIIAGLLFGLVRSRVGRNHYQPPVLVHTWLVVIAVLPQVFAFYYAPVARLTPAWLASVCLIVSLFGLLVFVGLNLGRPGIWLLGLGLVLNLIVIVLNGGLMPISPAVGVRLFTDHPVQALETGLRLAWSKDIVLARSDTVLWWFSDCFLLPRWFPVQIAFSIGDVLVALGAFWLLWSAGSPVQEKPKTSGGKISYYRDFLFRRNCLFRILTKETFHDHRGFILSDFWPYPPVNQNEGRRR